MKDENFLSAGVSPGGLSPCNFKEAHHGKS